MNLLRSAIFDLDGLLIDSETVVFDSLLQVMEWLKTR